MIILNLLFQPAVLWLIMYYVFGERSIPSFRPLALTIFVVGFFAALISSALDLIAIIPNFIIFSATLILIFRLDFKKTIISVGIFQAVMLIFALIQDSLF